MQYHYSPGTNSFYPEALRESYEQSKSWPDDTIEVSEAVFEKYTNPPEGKMRVAGKKGPEWADVPGPTKEQITANNELKKNQLISEVVELVNKNQWSGKAALGRIKDSEKTEYNNWIDYIDKLNSIDISVSEPEWPEKPQ